MGQSTLISGFTPIPITYPSTSTSAVTHYIYARVHSGSKKVKKGGLPDGRTLFLVNVPPDATEREVMKLFKSAGMVEKVVFGVENVEEVGLDGDDEDEEGEEEGEEGAETEQVMQVDGDKPKKRRKISKEEIPKVVPLPTAPLRTLRKTGGTAHVVFLDSSSLDRAVNSLSKPRSWPTTIEKEGEEPIGLSHYLSLYDSLRPPLDAVREHADTYIEVFEYELAKMKQKSQYKKGEAVVDEDGFTLVTRGGAYGQTLGGGVAVASKRFQQTGEARTRSNKRKERREKEGFYAFQKAEKQRKEILDLKRRWEEDKAKVEKLKASRQFRPY